MDPKRPTSVRTRFTPLKKLTFAPGLDPGALNTGVFLVQSKHSGTLYIEKRLNKHDMSDGHASREYRALRQCDHPNIVKCVAGDLDFGIGYGSIYMQHCDKGALDTLIRRYDDKGKRVPEGFVWKVFLGLARALGYLMYGIDAADGGDASLTITRSKSLRKKKWNHILHRDIKPGNIFLATPNDERKKYPDVLLGDLGCSVMIGDIDARVASEFVSRQAFAFRPPESPEYSRRSDVYQLGLVIHCLCKGVQVPECRERMIRDPVGSEYSKKLRELVNMCLEGDPRARPSTGELGSLVAKGARRFKDKYGCKELGSWAFG